MADNQQNEAFVEPPRDEIPGISRQHVAAMETSDADDTWIWVGMEHDFTTQPARESKT